MRLNGAWRKENGALGPNHNYTILLPNSGEAPQLFEEHGPNLTGVSDTYLQLFRSDDDLRGRAFLDSKEIPSIVRSKLVSNIRRVSPLSKKQPKHLAAAIARHTRANGHDRPGVLLAYQIFPESAKAYRNFATDLGKAHGPRTQFRALSKSRSHNRTRRTQRATPPRRGR